MVLLAVGGEFTVWVLVAACIVVVVVWCLFLVVPCSGVWCAVGCFGDACWVVLWVFVVWFCCGMFGWLVACWGLVVGVFVGCVWPVVFCGCFCLFHTHTLLFVFVLTHTGVRQGVALCVVVGVVCLRLECALGCGFF